MSDLAARVQREGPWYHTFELPGGVTTEGHFDLRGVVPRLPLPPSLGGSRCLDAGANEGFWSFELARRGAQEVVSLDLPDTTEQDWQGDPGSDLRRAGTGLANRHFSLVREALGADAVVRKDLNIYDVSPETTGTFDYIFVGNLLIHLADPVRALRALRSALRPGGHLLSLEGNSLALSMLTRRLPLAQLWNWGDQARWWTPNRAAHRRWIEAAELTVLSQGGPLFQPFGKAIPHRPDALPRKKRELLWWLFVRPVGPASGWVLARHPGD